MSSYYSSLDWVLSHWVHFTVHSLDLFLFICVYFVLLFFILHIHHVLKNDNDVAHYNFNARKLILVIFCTDVAE